MKMPFKYESIRQSSIFRVLVQFLPVALLIGVGSLLIHRTEVQRMQTEQARKQHETVIAGTVSISQTLQRIRHDLLYLASRPENLQLLDTPNDRNLSNLATDWAAFSYAKQVYDKIRWIDETGMERVRVDYEKDRPQIVWKSELQYKGQRYFFEETNKLSAGEVFVSPLDLNVEHDQIEQPINPTIRFGMPVFDSRGNHRGIFLINYSATDLLNRFAQITRLQERSSWLVNHEGYWLKGPHSEDEFGFMFGRNDLTLAQRYPDAWQTISNGENGQFTTEDGLWTFVTVYPLREWQVGQNGATSPSSGNNVRANATNYAWKTVSLLPASEYNAGIVTFNAKLAAVVFVLAVVFFLGASRIVHAQMEEETARFGLAEKEARLHSLVQTIPDMVWLKSEQGTYLACNHAAEQFFGAPEKTILGKTDYDFFPSELADSFRASDRITLISGIPTTYEEWISFPKDGRRALLETTKEVVRTADNQLVGVLGLSRDITERRQIENDLRDSHALLANLTAHVPGMLFQLRQYPDGSYTLPFISDGVSRFLGLTPQQVRNDANLLIQVIHPDDLPMTRASVDESVRTMQAWQHEFRVNLPTHGLRWLHGNAALEKLEDGSTLWHGYIADITERKQAEEGLMLAQMVYQRSSESVMITDIDNKIVAVNPAFERMTGYSAAEALGQNPRILSSGQHDASFYREMWSTLNSTGHWEGEFWNRRKDGKIYAAWRTIDIIRGEDGKVRYYVALTSDITVRKESEKLIWQQANFDVLTGLSNRSMFHEQLQSAIRKAHRSNQTMALILLDLDHFKDVNDTLGHDMGDTLLKEAADRLRACVRESDTVARLGGDEFTVILGELNEPASVDRVVQNILKQLSEPFQLKNEQIHISASVGVTFYPRDATEIDELLKNADQAMYAAKKDGRNRCNFYDQSMQEEALTRMRLVSDMRSVLDGRQFLLHYQPIVELGTGAIHKAEALIRWQHPLRGLIKPADFIHTAEETGMIVDIGNWVFRETTRQARLWRTSHHPEFQISLNMSPVQFRNDADLLDNWLIHLRELDLPGQGIAVEITESMLLDANENVNKTLLAFRDAGIQVSMDDFGTGYSSLVYLKRFDIDYIKIDRSFVRNLSADSDDLVLCEAIIVMAHKLGMKVIAEGVETQQQCALLKAVDCDFAQGLMRWSPPPYERVTLVGCFHFGGHHARDSIDRD
ncbi:MAG: EAL domain-containing protein [Burkholderiaceae bacterium]|nr:EAL domain-containing protein [Burkholderiaceae bacterium]